MSIIFKDLYFSFFANEKSLKNDVLKNINLKITTGKKIAIIGSTGSGKSTLLSHFNLIFLPTFGEIQIDNYLFNSGSKRKNLKKIIKIIRQKVNLSFQFPEYQLFEDTVKKDIIFGPKNLLKLQESSFFEFLLKLKFSFFKSIKYFFWYLFFNKKYRKKNFEEQLKILDFLTNEIKNLKIKKEKLLFWKLLKKWKKLSLFYDGFFDKLATKMVNIVGLGENFLKKSPFVLSGGEKRKVAIAGTIAIGGKYLILDEPTAGLDPQSEIELMQLFQTLNQSFKKTIVLVTHNMDHVLEIADYVFVLNKGMLVYQGEPYYVFANDNLLHTVGLEKPKIISFLDKLKEQNFDITSLQSSNINEFIYKLGTYLKKKKTRE